VRCHPPRLSEKADPPSRDHSADEEQKGGEEEPFEGEEGELRHHQRFYGELLRETETLRWEPPGPPVLAQFVIRLGESGEDGAQLSEPEGRV